MNEKSSVLIVDDEEVVRHAHLRSLEGTGCITRTAEDGFEAIRVMEEEVFDVVLLDLRMPGMDGMELLKALKQRWPDSEVVVITGYPTLESAKEALRLGAQNYIAKPVGPDQVIEAARAAITEKRWALRSGLAGSEAGKHNGKPTSH